MIFWSRFFFSGPCRAIAPVYDQLSLRFTGISFLHVDGDECEDVINANKVTAYPTFHFYAHGAKVSEMMGAKVDDLESNLEALSSK